MQAERLIARYEQRRAALLPVLHLIQDACGCIPAEAEEEIARFMDIPPVDLREVITFYTLYRSRPRAGFSRAGGS